MDVENISYFSAFLGTGILAALVALFAALRDRSHRGRYNLDRVSIVSWGLVSVLFSMLAIVLLATASKIYFS